jgi:phosphopantothenoylcysteine decarboxylase
MATGIADGLVTCIMRAWPFTNGRASKPVVLAPAMNTAMWLHPLTGQQLSILGQWGMVVVEPQRKVLACGEEGVGAMADVDTIVAAVRQHLSV